MSRESRNPNLNADRIASWTLINLYASIFKVPELYNERAAHSCQVISEKNVSRSNSLNFSIQYSVRDPESFESPRLGLYLEETAHFIHRVANPEVANFGSLNTKAYSQANTNEAKAEIFKESQRNMNVVEFFAQLASFQFLLRSDMQSIISRLTGTNESTTKKILVGIVYQLERSQCEGLPYQRIYDKNFSLSIRPLQNLPYLEAYLLLTEFSDEQVMVAPLAELIRFPLNELRKWAYAVVGPKKGEWIQQEFEQVLSEEADSGFWQFQS